MKKQLKKTLSLILSLMMIMSMFAGLDIISFAEYDSSSRLYYEINDEAVTIVGGDISRNEGIFSGQVTIPDTIEGYPVTAITDYIFSNCENLTSIKIGKNMKVISPSMVFQCYNLRKFIVDENNTNFSNDENGVLFNKDKTVLILYPMGNSRTEYVIPDSVKTIGSWAFNDCCNLTEIIVPDSVTAIEEEAFSYCLNLKNITIPDRVSSIGAGAFRSTSITDIEIPVNVTIINERLFQSCKNLKKVTMSAEVTSIENFAFQYCENLSDIVIPANVTSIGAYAFEKCVSLSEIIISDSVKTIRYRAFYYCTSLENVIIGEGTQTIEDDAFYNCVSLKEVIIPSSVTTIGQFAFGMRYDAENHESIEIDGFTIYGISGTAAESYVSGRHKLNGMIFISIGSEEPPVEEPPVEEPPVEEPPVEEPPVEEPPVEEPPVEEPPVEEPPVEEPPVEEPPVEEPPVEEPPVEEPSDNGQLEVKGDGGITTDFERKISQIAKEQTVENLSEMIENENFAIVDKNGNAIADNAFVGTGSKIQILAEDGSVLNEYTIVVPTDIDGNGKTTAADARLALRASAQLENLEGVYSDAADITGDGKITASDARKILRIAANLEK